MRRQKFALGDQGVYVISPEDLILAKLEWSKESLSEMHAKDIQNILRVSREQIDNDYLFENAITLGVKERLDKLYAEI